MGQVNVPTDLERGELLAEKVDRREFIDLLKRMLTMDQVLRIIGLGKDKLGLFRSERIYRPPQTDVDYGSVD